MKYAAKVYRMPDGVVEVVQLVKEGERYKDKLQADKMIDPTPTQAAEVGIAVLKALEGELAT